MARYSDSEHLRPAPVSSKLLETQEENSRDIIGLRQSIISRDIKYIPSNLRFDGVAESYTDAVCSEFC